MNENRFVGPIRPSGDNHATSIPIASWSSMMMKTNLHARSGAAAIAAVLALSSTPALTQEADPAAAAPAETLTTTTAPVEEPAATETPAATTTAAEPAPTATPAPVKRTATAKKATAAAARPVPRAAPVEAAAPAPAVAAVEPLPPMITPEPVAPPPAAPVAAAEPAGIDTEDAAMLGGGALTLLALGGAALAMRRRRREAEEDAWEYEAYEPVAAEAPTPAPAPQPVVAPAQVAAPVQPEPVLELTHGHVAPAASAFAWGNTPAVVRPAPKADPIVADDDGSDRRPGESWVDRAQRGPSPANPSVSLKNRLRRAAFFDKRERDVAAGTAIPVETDAGLPDNMDDPQIATQQRELQPA